MNWKFITHLFNLIRNNRNEEASHWIISEVCPLNVIYKRGEEVFAEYGINTFVSAGEIHILDDKGMEIESCVVNGQPIEKTDGVWSIVINKATTIIVEFEDGDDEGDEGEDEPTVNEWVDAELGNKLFVIDLDGDTKYQTAALANLNNRISGDAGQNTAV